jgi:hypothetical protein
VSSSLTCFWRERAIWLLVNVYLGEMRSGLSPERCVGRDGDGVCSLSALKDRVDLPPDAVSIFVQTTRLVMGEGAG